MIGVRNTQSALAATSIVRRFPVYCWPLLIGYVLAPMTSWRIWKVGPGEVFCLLGCLEFLRSRSKGEGGLSRLTIKINFLSGFWVAFLGLATVGTLWCSLVYPQESIPSQLLTWVYLAFISILSYDALREVDGVEQLLVFACCLSAAWYALLYVYGERITTSFFGADLWFGGHSRYSGGASNPHQLALPMAVGAVVLFSEALQKHSALQKRIACLGFAGVSVWLLLETASSTGMMALGVGLTVMLFSQVEDRRIRIVAICLTLSVCILFSEQLIQMFMRWVNSDSNGNGRLQIYATYPITFDKGPLFGLGTGSHARGGIQEFHNTYLEVLAMGGLAGGLIFFVFTIQCYLRVRDNPVSIAILFALYAFGFAGFALRRLVYWLMLSFAINVSNKSEKKLVSFAGEVGWSSV